MTVVAEGEAAEDEAVEDAETASEEKAESVADAVTESEAEADCTDIVISIPPHLSSRRRFDSHPVH